MDELHYWSATDVLAAFRTRELSPVEVLDAVLARADAVEPTVHALLELDRDASRAAAEEAAARYAGRGPAPRELEGLPVALKEEHAILGRTNLFGSTAIDEWVPDLDQPIIERMLGAGALAHARTTAPEFSCAGFTHSTLWGTTRNPWNPEFTPGGSSGGSGAALASGTAYLASGSDIGGSIRIPASFCGVVGFKAPYGRVPGLPPMSLDTYCHDGPMARTVADVALLHNVIAGRHRTDHVSLPAVRIPRDLGAVRGTRIALATTLGDYPVDADVVANTRAFADALRDAGAVVDEVEVALSRRDVMSAAFVHYGAIICAAIEELVPPDDDRLMPYTRDFLARGRSELERHGFYGGLAIESTIHQALARVFDDHDVLVCPTMATTGLLAGDDYVDRRVTVDGVELEHYLESALTPVFNIASRHPVLSVPSGRAGNGVPTGVQVVARPYDDITAFHAGAAAERRLRLWADPGWRPAL